MGVLKLYRLGRWFHQHHVPFVPGVMYRLIFLLSGAVIPMSAEIGDGTVLAYGANGLVLHPHARVGKRVTLSPQVTLGGRCGHPGVPVLEDDVHVGVGAKILGPVRIGAGARIGANAVVLTDVPARAVAAGVPARILRTNVAPCGCGVGQEPSLFHPTSTATGTHGRAN